MQTRAMQARLKRKNVISTEMLLKQMASLTLSSMLLMAIACWWIDLLAK
ncbi:MAG: hypothetical protein MJ250_01755 [Alphaproteobacteria bacterium]|nr:hypothetical protein [Alphaproteobacteria bacterium]